MAVNLSYNNSNDSNDSGGNNKNINIDINPSGKMPVLPNPNPDGRPPVTKTKHSFFSPFTRTVILISAVVGLLATALVWVNVRDYRDISDDNNNNNDNYIQENEIEEIDSYLSDSEICGRWTLLDYVENIGDFDADNRNYIKYEMQLYSHAYEFFEDGRVVINYLQSEEIFAWINKDKFNIFPDDADIITVHAVKNIKKIDYIFIEDKHINNMTGVEIPGYYVLRKSRDKEIFTYDDIRNKDLRNYNLSDGENIIKTLLFNEKTRFPTDKNKMPLAYECQPWYIIEHGKNPGFGIRELHKQGITGKGVNIAIIDEPLILDHPEYKGKIIEYRDFDSQADSSVQGPAIASLLAGETTGVAPGVNIYYAAVPAWNMYDAEYYARALDWIVEINKTLPPDEKIKAVCISPNPENPLPWINVDKYLKSFQNAEKEGLLVLDCSDEHGVVIGACGYDFDNPEDVALCKPKSLYRIMIASYHYDTVRDIYIDESEESNENMLRAPVNYRTIAEIYNNREFSYQYDGKGQLSWAIPYVTGVMAMGWQVRPALTADEMIKILFDTAYVDKINNKYIYPVNFIEYLKNN